MALPSETIRRYYERVDANDVEWIVALFAADAVYERAGSRFEGIDSIREFFAVQRRIRGVHRLESLWSMNDVVVVTGRFEGVAGSGEPRSIGFSDVWRFNAAGEVRRRQSYLALGHEFVRD